jgi:hypothetical protein
VAVIPAGNERCFQGHGPCLAIYALVRAETLPTPSALTTASVDVWGCGGVGRQATASLNKLEEGNPQQLLGILMVGATGIERTDRPAVRDLCRVKASKGLIARPHSQNDRGEVPRQRPFERLIVSR